MNSINQQQPETNHEDLYGDEAAKKIKELAKKAGTCFLCTAANMDQLFQARPMSVQQADEEGNLWFLSAGDSRLNEQINADSRVQLLFQGSAHSDFMSVYGTAAISHDKEKIHEFWQPLFKTWFTEGENDPRITVIKVETAEGYYWDNKHGNAAALIKMAIGAMMGKTLDDSIEGKLSVTSSK